MDQNIATPRLSFFVVVFFKYIYTQSVVDVHTLLMLKGDSLSRSERLDSVGLYIVRLFCHERVSVLEQHNLGRLNIWKAFT